jgi:hypothetical protein
MILVLPGLFGLALLGEGINKMVHEEKGGVAFLLFGFLFIGMVVFAYLFLSSYLIVHRGV